jgi:translocation and assembly module TamB
LSGPLKFTATGLPKPTDLGAGTVNNNTPLDATVTAQINGQLDARPSSSDKRMAAPTPQGQTLPNVQLTFDAALSKTNLTARGYVVTVPRWSVSAAGSQADGRSTFKRDDQGGMALQTSTTWRNFDPLPWYAGEPGSVWREGGHRLDGQLQADVSWPSGGVQRSSKVDGTSMQSALAWIEHARGDVTLDMDNSRLANVPLQVKATWRHTGTAPANVDLRIVSGTNTAQVTGQLAANADNDRWKVNALLPQTVTLAPALRLVPALAAWQPTSGAAQLDVSVQGRWPPVASEGSASLSGTQIGQLRVRQATARWRTNQDPQAPLSLLVEACDLSGTTPACQC